MKRVITLITVLVFCMALACPAFATETFVPSISDKNEPEIEGGVALVDGDGEIIEELEEGCLIVTPVSEAELSEEIPDEALEELMDVYEQLTEGTMTLPSEEDLVIRDLFDASLVCTDGHEEKLNEEDVYIQITFDLGIGADEYVTIMAYVNGEWVPAYKLVNNGDGTVTAMLEQLCPIAIAVRAAQDGPSQTADDSGVMIWTAMMLSAVAALAAMQMLRRKASC